MTEGYKLVATVPDGQSVVGMVEYQGTVIVATTGGVYRFNGVELEPIRFCTLDAEAAKTGEER